MFGYWKFWGKETHMKNKNKEMDKKNYKYCFSMFVNK